MNSTNQVLVKDEFLSGVFGMPWMRTDGPLSIEKYDTITTLLASLPPNTKVDVEVKAGDITLAYLLQRNGWYLGNTKITFFHNPDVTLLSLPDFGGIDITPLKQYHIETLIEQSSDFFLFDRYRSDPNLDKTKIADLYRQWLSNNINYRCEEILTAVHGDKLLGFVCVIKRPDHIFFELIGVLIEEQKKGLGTILVNNAVKRYCDMPIKVITQYNNIPMQRVLINCGFKPIDATSVFTIHL